ncbi:flagellin, partial [Clostridium sp. HBUAS56010]|uniref:flagellin N-terminal helical domain-containing protein n=1 Tax=Clostridium sp. HBUAS56010 TaxID=2571127 RepID=UPI001177B2FB
RAGDDAAGLAISEKMRAQITGLETAQKNANDGISLVQTAEGALTEVHSMLNRMVELAQQSANGTYQDTVDRENIQKEMNSLTKEIDRISTGTNFNGINLLDGGLDASPKSVDTKVGSVDAKTEAFSFKVSGAAEEGFQVAFKASAAETDATYAKKVTASITDKKLTIDISSTDAASITQKDIDDAIAAAKTKAAEDAKSADDTTKAAGESALKAFADAGNFKVTLGGDIKLSVKTEAGSIVEANATSAATVKGDGTPLTLQIGESSEDHNKLDVNIAAMSTEGLGLTDVKVDTQANAADAVQVIKNAINTVSNTRGDLGALQNRLEHTINNLSVTSENMTAAESRIRDVDMAKEMMSYTKNNILVQASQAMLAQANQVPQGVLQLLK